MENLFGKKIVAVLIMLSLVLTTGTFAYWATYVEGTDSDTTDVLEIGTGDAIETRFDLTNDLNSGGLLVPAGQAVNSGVGAVEAINLSFDVQWVEDEATSQTTGISSVGQIEVSHVVVIELDGEVLDSTEYSAIYDLVNVIYNAGNATELTLDASAQTLAFQITLDEPSGQEQYDLIATAEISITFSYSIATADVVSTDVQ